MSNRTPKETYRRCFFYKVYSNECKKTSIHYSTSSTGCWIVARRSMNQRKNLSEDLIEILKSSDMRTDLIEYYPCDTLNQLLLRLDYHVRNNECINTPLNDFDRKMMTIYKDLSRHDYYSKVRKNPEFRQRKREYMREYYKNNPEKYKEYNDKYVQNNYQLWFERNNRIITCECGRKVKRPYLPKHLKSNIHKRLLEQALQSKEESKTSMKVKS